MWDLENPGLVLTEPGRNSGPRAQCLLNIPIVMEYLPSLTIGT